MPKDINIPDPRKYKIKSSFDTYKKGVIFGTEKTASERKVKETVPGPGYYKEANKLKLLAKPTGFSFSKAPKLWQKYKDKYFYMRSIKKDIHN